MTSCQEFYCTNEKGKCEKIFFCNYRSVTTKNTRKYDSIGDKKEKKACVRVKRVQTDSYICI